MPPASRIAAWLAALPRARKFNARAACSWPPAAPFVTSATSGSMAPAATIASAASQSAAPWHANVLAA